MDQAKLGYYRSLLLREKGELEHQKEVNNRFNLEDSMRETELSSYDNHPADLGTETFERGKDLALQEVSNTYLAEIEDALHRMEEGTYGICAQCREPIPQERLEVMPTARYCIKHQQERDFERWEGKTPESRDFGSRPVEEEFLAPPFGRTDYDEREEPIFDGEDAWQSVERYGSSDTPDTYGGKLSYDEIFVESDEPEGFVEPVEGFIVTDIEGGAGENYDVARNATYRTYLDDDEGEEGNALNLDDE